MRFEIGQDNTDIKYSWLELKTICSRSSKMQYTTQSHIRSEIGQDNAGIEYSWLELKTICSRSSKMQYTIQSQRLIKTVITMIIIIGNN